MAYGVIMAIINALTVNVEDYFQAPAFRRSIKESDWELLSPRVEYAIDKILLLLSDHNISATFFVYAWTIRLFPQMIKKIALQGHELAYRHQYNSAYPILIKPSTVIELKENKDKLAQITSSDVTGFRSDSAVFSLDNDWLYDELILAGYEYSSSVNVQKKWPQQWQLVSSVSTLRSNFLELPVSTHSFLNRRWEVINSNALKLRRYEATHRLVDKHADETKTPVLASVSSWMLDDNQPNIRADNLFNKWLHNYHTKEAPLILHQLFAEYRWETIKSVYLNKVVSLKNLKRKNGQYLIR
jgi:polysaccharide deacetylase family protein (PEP-CTERM system associated)